jgi:hypothetical protein
MPITQLSYHICDFIQDTNGRIYVLEFGDAFYNSNFAGRLIFSKVDVRSKLIPEHIARMGVIRHQWNSIRHERQVRNLRRFLEDCDPPVDLPADPNRQQITVVMGERDGLHMEEIQELAAQHKVNPAQGLPSVLLNGTSDMMFMINRDKRIVNSLLNLNGLSELQPRTWYYDCQPNSVLPDAQDIQHFIIKPTDESLADGILVVAKDDLAAVLNAIAQQNSSSLTPAQTELYKENIIYYKNRNKNLLIQELCLSKTISGHHAAGRAVFAVILEDGKLRIEMLDLFWQLAISPAQAEQHTFSSIISAKAKFNPTFNCWPSMTVTEKASVEPELISILIKIMKIASSMDMHDYVMKLAELNRVSDIEYLLNHNSRFRVERLDPKFIATISKINLPLAQDYLLNQAQYFLLGHHLVFAQDGALAQWLETETPSFSQKLKTRLQAFIQQEFANLADLGIKKEGSPWLARVMRIKEILKNNCWPAAQSLPFFAQDPAGIETTKTEQKIEHHISNIP